MPKTIKKLLALILCCVCLISVFPHTAFAANGDEVRAAKKIISVVYDDSSSMLGDNWVYANYAMQALTAQLNEQDELYITYMSAPKKARTVNLSDIDGAVSDEDDLLRAFHDVYDATGTYLEFKASNGITLDGEKLQEISGTSCNLKCSII